jgi:acyl dehydratase
MASRIFKVGDAYELIRVFTAADVQKFAELSGDFNRVHFDAVYCREHTPFGRPVVHGMLVGSLFSTIVGQLFLGPGSIYVAQSLNFKAPVFLDESVTARVEITNIAIRKDAAVVDLVTRVFKDNSKLVIDGQGRAFCPHLKDSVVPSHPLPASKL